jgi:hypothetical protein
MQHSSVFARPGLFVSSGFSGHGFGIGPAAGRLAADLILGDMKSFLAAALPHPRGHAPGAARASGILPTTRRQVAAGPTNISSVMNSPHAER